MKKAPRTRSCFNPFTTCGMYSVLWQPNTINPSQSHGMHVNSYHNRGIWQKCESVLPSIDLDRAPEQQKSESEFRTLPKSISHLGNWQSIFSVWILNSYDRNSTKYGTPKEYRPDVSRPKLREICSLVSILFLVLHRSLGPAPCDPRSLVLA